jgi:hypothetical protein
MHRPKKKVFGFFPPLGMTHLMHMEYEGKKTSGKTQTLVPYQEGRVGKKQFPKKMPKKQINLSSILSKSTKMKSTKILDKKQRKMCSR